MSEEGFKNPYEFNLDKLNSLTSISAKGMYLFESLKTTNNKFDVVFILEKARMLNLEEEDMKQIEKLALLKIEELSLKDGEMSLQDKLYVLNVLHKLPDFSIEDFKKEFGEILSSEPLDSFKNFERLLYVLDSWIDKLSESENSSIYKKLAINLISLFVNKIEDAKTQKELDDIEFQLKRYEGLITVQMEKINVDAIEKRIKQKRKEI